MDRWEGRYGDIDAMNWTTIIALLALSLSVFDIVLTARRERRHRLAARALEEAVAQRKLAKMEAMEKAAVVKEVPAKIEKQTPRVPIQAVRRRSWQQSRAELERKSLEESNAR